MEPNITFIVGAHFLPIHLSLTKNEQIKLKGNKRFEECNSQEHDGGCRADKHWTNNSANDQDDRNVKTDDPEKDQITIETATVGNKLQQTAKQAVNNLFQK